MCPAAACRATNFSTGPEDQFFSSELLRRQIQFCFICWQRSVRSGLKQIAKGSFFQESTDAFCHILKHMNQIILRQTYARFISSFVFCFSSFLATKLPKSAVIFRQRQYSWFFRFSSFTKNENGMKRSLISESVPNHYPELHLFLWKIHDSDFEDGDKARTYLQPIMAMRFSAMFTFQLDNTKR